MLYNLKYPFAKQTLYFERNQVLPLKEKEYKKHQVLLHFNVQLPKPKPINSIFQKQDHFNILINKLLKLKGV